MTQEEFETALAAMVRILTDLPINAVASYGELSAAAGFSVQAKFKALYLAREQVERETGLRFSTERGLGVKKLDGPAVAGIGQRARRSIARRARKAGDRLATHRYNLERTDQQKIDIERSILGAAEAAARAKAKQVEPTVKLGPVLPDRIFDLLRGDQ